MDLYQAFDTMKGNIEFDEAHLIERKKLRKLFFIVFFAQRIRFKT